MADRKGHPKQIHRTEIRPIPHVQGDPGLPINLLNEVDNYVSKIPFVLVLAEQVPQNNPPGCVNLSSWPTTVEDTESDGSEDKVLRRS